MCNCSYHCIILILSCHENIDIHTAAICCIWSGNLQDNRRVLYPMTCTFASQCHCTLLYIETCHHMKIKQAKVINQWFSATLSLSSGTLPTWVRYVTGTNSASNLNNLQIWSNGDNIITTAYVGIYYCRLLSISFKQIRHIIIDTEKYQQKTTEIWLSKHYTIDYILHLKRISNLLKFFWPTITWFSIKNIRIGEKTSIESLCFLSTTNMSQVRYQH